MFLACVLGEVLAIFHIGQLAFLLLPIIVIIKIITKRPVGVFVMIFFALLVGFLVTDNALNDYELIKKNAGKEIVLSGYVNEIVEQKNGFNIYVEQAEFLDNRVNEIIVFTKEKPEIKIGCKICAEGILKDFDHATNPGNFDLNEYFKSLGIYGKLELRRIISKNQQYDYLKNNLAQTRSNIKEAFEKICDCNNWIIRDKAPIFEGILIGEKQNIDSETKELYSLSGIAHILAISGLHISIIGMFVYKSFRRRFRFTLAAVASTIVVVSFGLMTGMAVATIRAVVMFMLKLLGEILGRRYDYIISMSVAGIILFLWSPFIIFNSGFQMSFASIFAITVVWPKAKKYLCINKKKKLSYIVLNGVSFGICINIIMMPVIARAYYQIPMYSMFLNMLVVPLMSVVVVAAVLAVLVKPVSVMVSRIMIFPGCAILEFFNQISRLTLKLPYANIIVGRISVIWMCIYYIAVLIVIFILSRLHKKYEKRSRSIKEDIDEDGIDIEKLDNSIMRNNYSIYYARLIWIVAYFICILMINNINIYHWIGTDKLEIAAIDVGQGDGIFIHTPGNINITIDGGSTSKKDVGKHNIIPYLKSNSIGVIDYAVITHVDEDHISGVRELIEQSGNVGIKVCNLVLPKINNIDKEYAALENSARIKNIKVMYIENNNQMNFDKVKIECLNPDINKSYEDRNDSSTVLSLSYNKFSMLFTGDISGAVEDEIVNQINQKYTILKAAHHGSKYSTTTEFLNKVNPRYAVVSVGERNNYGHPNDETLSRIKNASCSILRTDISGAIEIVTDGFNITIGKGIKQ